MAAIFLAPLYFIANGYILFWLLRWLQVTAPVLSRGIGMVAVLTVYSFFMLSLLTSFLVRVNPYRKYLKKISDQWLGSFAYILIIILLLDGLHHLLRRTRLVNTWLYTERGMAFCGAMAAAVMCFVVIGGILKANDLKLTKHTVTIDKTLKNSETGTLKIALIADLHIGNSIGKRHVEKVVDMVNEAEPDLIVIAGDLFDNDFPTMEEPWETAQLLAGMKSRLGTWACWGNHDINEKILAGFTFPSPGGITVDASFQEFLEKSEIRMLCDEAVLVDDSFYLVGRKDPQRIEKTKETRKKPKELLEGLPKELPVIVIDHQPKQLRELARAGADLDLSGHTHNGQVFPINLLLHLLWKNPYGIKKVGGMYSVVTSGAGYWGPGLRVGTSNEVMLLEVHAHAEE